MDAAADFLRSQQADLNSLDMDAYGTSSGNSTKNFDAFNDMDRKVEIPEEKYELKSAEEQKQLSEQKPTREIEKIQSEKMIRWRRDFEDRIEKIQSAENEKVQS